MKKLLLTSAAALIVLYSQSQCWANFSYIQNGATTAFTDLSTVVPSNPWGTNYSLSWDWDFGDGNTSTLQNPTHTYSNGNYTPCLTLTFFDSTSMNICISVYCDSILIGNAPPASWDCMPATGCYDPGTGLGQYATLSACQIACGVPCPGAAIISQNGNTFTANVTGGGIAPFIYLWSTGESTQSITATSNINGYCDITDANGCVYTGSYSYNSGQYVPCDSLTITSTGGGNQSFLMISLNLAILPIPVDYWVTTSNDGTILGEDSMSTSHHIHNISPITTLPYDTINTCLTYTLNTPNTMTCCVTWIWNGSFWSQLGSLTSIREVKSHNKKLLKVVDMLGRKIKLLENKPLFYIYDDGSVEKKIIFE